MTYQSDPTRWTESPGDAPELLQSAIRACVDEGPSDFQMRSLALKLAVVGGGAAVMASAASASASVASASASTVAAGGTIAASSGGALTFVKVAAVSVALLGAAATGAVMVRRDAAPVESARQRAPIAAPITQQVAEASDVEQAARPIAEPARPIAARAPNDAPRPVAVAAAAAPVPPAETTSAEEGSSIHPNAADDDAREVRRAERRQARHQARVARSSHAPDAPTSQVDLPREVSRSASARGASAGELEMLHHARAALSVRPLSAFALTEQHRASYPNGVFTQERDALAVEALLRAGDMDRARSLAERFIEKYPSSPHAHRFRETMKLQ